MSLNEGWTGRDDNLAIIAGATRGTNIDVVTNGDDEVSRIRGYDVFHKMISEGGIAGRYGPNLLGPPPGPHGLSLIWMCNPSAEGITEGIEQMTAWGCVGIIADITFPWRWPERVVGPPPGWLDDARIARVERNVREAVVVTTSIEPLVEHLRKLNPNVVYIPDLTPDTEMDWQVGVTAMITLAGKVMSGRRHNHSRAQTRLQRLLAWFKRR